MQNNIRKRVVLMYDGASSAYAGAEVFFINTASELHRKGFDITLVDLPDSLILTHLNGIGVPFKFVPFRKGCRLALPDDRYDYMLITNSKIYHCCRLKLNSDCKVLIVEIDKDFWDDRNKGGSLFGRLSDFTMRKWRQRMIDGGALAVLEDSASKLARTKGYRNVERMKHVPLMVLPSPTHTRIRSTPKDGTWRFLGIARDTEYKIAPLAHFFPKLREALPCATFKFVTHNPVHAEEIFRRFGVDFVKCVSGMNPEALNAYIDNEADCIIAMGTTSLNAASLGIPTLVADASNIWPYPTDRFRRIHDCHENLGEYVTNDVKPLYGISVADAVDALLHGYENLSRAAASFVCEKHSPEVFASSVISALEASDMDFRHYYFHTRFGVVR